MAGKSLKTLSVSLEQARSGLVNEYVKQARTVWGALTPADWWNDGMTYAVAARMALLEMAMIQQVRQLGVAYADETLKLVGVNPKGNVQNLVFPRDNTDPWLVAQRPADTYREWAVKNPTIRPKDWPSKTDETFEEVSRWLSHAFDRLQATAEEDAARWASTGVARCCSIAGCCIPNCPRPAHAVCASWRLTDGIRHPTFCRCTPTAIAASPQPAVITTPDSN